MQKKTIPTRKTRKTKIKEDDIVPYRTGCPFCNSGNQEFSSEEPKGKIIEYRYCTDCGGNWTDTYTIEERYITGLPDRNNAIRD